MRGVPRRESSGGGSSRASAAPTSRRGAAAAIIAAGIIGAEVQHYQDPEQIDLRAVLDTLVVQLEAWLMPRATIRGLPSQEG
jgi:DNA primase